MSAERRVFPDYKPLNPRKRSSKRLPWFAAGLGIPLLAFALIGPRDDSRPASADEAPTNMASPKAELLTAGSAPQEAAVSHAGQDRLAPATADGPTLPAPDGTEVVLKIRRGDSLDVLFARNDLSRADLAGMTATELGRKHLRLIRPGDEILVRHDAGRVLSRTELLERVWKLRNYGNTRTVDNFISRLRRRFESDPSSPNHFLSVRGAGYKFVA